MPTEPSEGFADNWAYLRMELRWLDQVLMLAVARQRKENHEIDRVTHARADRVTSSWWKGIISTEGKAVYDEHRQPTPAGSKTTYPQQLESKIQASHGKGIVLALPSLRDRLKLTPFEKNLVLMSLAPEINRRYARLYRYLQGDELANKTDLPTLDLVLRLMCRNDVEWRDARHHLVTASPLIRLQLLHLSPHLSDSLLNCPLKLAAPLVNYLLAGQPTERDLQALLQPPPAPLVRSTPLIQTELAVDWSDLVLPSSLISSLQSLTQQLPGQTQAKNQWGFQSDSLLSGTIAVLAGATGTGKTRAAAAIAHALKTSLSSLDLALIDPSDAAPLQDLIAKAPPVLLLKSAELWFGRSALLAPHVLRQFWAARQQIRGILLLSVCREPALQFQWRQQVDQILVFPLPTLSDRLQLWQKAFPPEIPLSPDIDWQALANLPLNGGEITAIAHTAILCATAANQVEMQHLVQGLTQRGKSLQRSSNSRQATAISKPSRSTKAATAPSQKTATSAKQASSSKASQKTQTQKRKQG